MSSAPTPTSNPAALVWTGRVISALMILALGAAGVAKIIQPASFMEEMAKSGISPSLAFGLGVTLVTSVILYAIPQTAIVGAILLTGYMGGAIAAHVLKGEDFTMQALFPVLVWLGIFLRDARLRSILPFRSL